MGRALLSLLLLPLFAHTAEAHVLPEAEFTRRIELFLDPAGVTVRYTITLSEDSMILDGLTFQNAALLAQLRSSPREAFFNWYVPAKGERIAGSFIGGTRMSSSSTTRLKFSLAAFTQ